MRYPNNSSVFLEFNLFWLVNIFAISIKHVVILLFGAIWPEFLASGDVFCVVAVIPLLLGLEFKLLGLCVCGDGKFNGGKLRWWILLGISSLVG